MKMAKKTFVKFEERYTRLRTIGKGSFGEVWASLDLRSGFREVAIKTTSVSTEVGRTAVDRELEILRTVRHENIIQLIESSTIGTDVHIVLERGDMSLHAYLHRHGVFHTKIALPIVFGIASGLAALHAHGYVHTDLKMENVVMVGFTPKVIDFGCARRVESFTTEFSSFPGETPYLTTRWYRSPEMILGITESMNHAMDMWALGCIAYTLVTGRVLFPGVNEEDMLAWFDLILGPMPAALSDEAVNEPGMFLREASVVDSTTPLPYEAYAPAEWCEHVIAHVAEVARNTVTSTRLRSRDLGELLFSRISPRASVDLHDLVRDTRYYTILRSMLEYNPSMRVSASDLLTM
jgi:serine/threonine protein kinase